MQPARGLWGSKHTRKPVDDLVGLARGLGPGAPLPFLQLTVSARGVVLSADKANTCPTPDTGGHTGGRWARRRSGRGACRSSTPTWRR